MSIVQNGSHEAVVYYLTTQFGGIVKIGTTMNLDLRIRRLRKVQPAAKFILLATEPGDVHLEASRHREFRPSYHQGEWYWLTPELQNHIESLRAGS